MCNNAILAFTVYSELVEFSVVLGEGWKQSTPYICVTAADSDADAAAVVVVYENEWVFR